VVVASSGLVAAGSAPALAGGFDGADPGAVTSRARAVVRAQSLASVPSTADWALDVPPITVTSPEPAPEDPPSNDSPAEPAAPSEEPTETEAAQAAAAAEDKARAAEAAQAAKAAKAAQAEKRAARAAKKAARAAQAEERAAAASSDDADVSESDERVSDPTSPEDRVKADVKAAKAESSGAAVLEIAGRYVGVPYVYGGHSPRGFDCSGFTQYVYAQLGVELPHQSERQRSVGRVVSRAEARPGDIVWVPGHVGIYAGGNKMVDAARAGTSVQYRRMWQSNPTFIRVLD
jgi:cell wall-associated NlpC family hydrolase